LQKTRGHKHYNMSTRSRKDYSTRWSP